MEQCGGGGLEVPAQLTIAMWKGSGPLGAMVSIGGLARYG